MSTKAMKTKRRKLRHGARRIIETTFKIEVARFMMGLSSALVSMVPDAHPAKPLVKELADEWSQWRKYNDF